MYHNICVCSESVNIILERFFFFLINLVKKYINIPMTVCDTVYTICRLPVSYGVFLSLLTKLL